MHLSTSNGLKGYLTLASILMFPINWFSHNV